MTTAPPAAKFTHCPTCRNPLVASAAMVPGFTCYVCRTCRKVAVDIPGTTLAWRLGGEGAVELLRAEAERATRYLRVKDSDDSDPAWSSIA